MPALSTKPGSLSVAMNVEVSLTLEVHLTNSVSTSKVELWQFPHYSEGQSLVFFLPNSLGKTVYMIHFAEIRKIMTSTRHI